MELRVPMDADIRYTHVVYGLQAASFLLGFTFVVAAIMNYIHRNEVRGTWLESHFRWQLRTFWFGLIWGVLGGITTFIGIGYLILAVNAVWLVYRIVKGWLWLADRRPMYQG